jgi:hypothetical protein
MQEALRKSVTRYTEKAAPAPDPKGTVRAHRRRQRNTPNVDGLAGPRVAAPQTEKEKNKGKRICYAFQTGFCAKGKDCNYSHVKERNPPTGRREKHKIRPKANSSRLDHASLEIPVRTCTEPPRKGRARQKETAKEKRKARYHQPSRSLSAEAEENRRASLLE